MQAVIRQTDMKAKSLHQNTEDEPLVLQPKTTQGCRGPSGRSAAVEAQSGQLAGTPPGAVRGRGRGAKPESLAATSPERCN